MQYVVELELGLRPIRIAHLVNPLNRKEILDAIEINTFLWGGTNNPIIPSYKRLPRKLKDLRHRTTEQLIAGYLNSYDPDYIISHESTGPIAATVNRRLPVVSAAHMLETFAKKFVPEYGIGFFEVFTALEKEELRFVPRSPLEIIYAQIDKNYKTFLAAAFGYLSAPVFDVFYKNFLKKLEIPVETFSLSNYTKGLLKQTTRKLTSFHETKNPDRKGWSSFNSTFLFYMDATSTQDIIDYWNLRAAGWLALPIPVQISASESVKNFAATFIEENHSTLPGDGKLFKKISLLKSRTTTLSDFNGFVREYSALTPPVNNEPKTLVQDWYPPLWDKRMLELNRYKLECLRSKSISSEVTSFERRVSFSLLSPDFLLGSPGNITSRYANDISFSVYSDKERFAEVIPEGRDEYAEEMGFYAGSNDFRFSSKGLVKYGQIDDRGTFQLPTAESILLKWLKSQGWETNLSSSGLIAKQMLNQLGGRYGLNLLALKGIVRLLGQFSGDQTAKEEFIKRELSKIAGSESYDAEFILERLTEARIFRLGIELQCPICTQRSWYSISDAEYQVQCTKCLADFSIPSHRPRDIHWTYRTYGAFSLPRQAYGAYSVLLTLRFFMNIMEGLTTPLLSFEARKDGLHIEADLALFFQKHRFPWSTAKRWTIFAECKTFNSFQRKDVMRMELLGRKFPGSILVFASLNESFDEEEKLVLQRCALRSRKKQALGKPFNPILILSGHELFSKFTPPDCWVGLSKKPVENHSVSLDLIHLCDATQQLHLDMEGFTYLPPAEV